MPPNHDPEALLRRLVGVKAARIEWVDSAVARVHVISDGVRAPGGLVRDIVGVLIRQCGLEVAPQTVHVVELKPDLLTEDRDVRPRLAGISWQQADGETDVTCRLLNGDGLAEGTARDRDPVRASARATVDAIGVVVGGSVGLRLLDLRVVDTARGSVVVVVVETSEGEAVSGSAIADADLIEAGAKAALDALNRQLGQWMGRRYHPPSPL